MVNTRLVFGFLRLILVYRRIMRHPRLFDYMDEALTPVEEAAPADRNAVQPLDSEVAAAMLAPEDEAVASAMSA